MKEPYTEGLATHGDPESCAGGARDKPKAAGEALTGACTGRATSREIFSSRAPAPSRHASATRHRAKMRARGWLCAVNDPRQVQNLFAREPGDPLTAREQNLGPHREGLSPKPMMNGQRKSDSSVVPTKSPNKAKAPAAEVMEGRELAKGNSTQQNASRTQCRTMRAKCAGPDTTSQKSVRRLTRGKSRVR